MPQLLIEMGGEIPNNETTDSQASRNAAVGICSPSTPTSLNERLMVEKKVAMLYPGSPLVV